MAAHVTAASLRGDRASSDSVAKLVKRHVGTQGALLSVLEELQAQHGYLPEDALRAVAREMELSLVDVYGVATFYKSFTLKPRGKHLITACLGTACHVRGAQRVVEAFQRRLDVKAGETTPDGEFTLETVNCLGVCALGPMVVVDGQYLSNVGETKVEQIVDAARTGFYCAQKEEDGAPFGMEVSCPGCGRSLMDRTHRIDGHPAVRLAAPFKRKRGCFRFSSLYGSNTKELDPEVPPGTVLSLCCPYCRANLAGTSRCPECGETMACTMVKGGGLLEICPRAGCKGQVLDVNAVPPRTKGRRHGKAPITR